MPRKVIEHHRDRRGGNRISTALESLKMNRRWAVGCDLHVPSEILPAPESGLQQG